MPYRALALRVALAGLALGALCLVACAAEPWRDENYPYRVEITIDNGNVDEALENFPLLVKLEDDSLPGSVGIAKAKIAEDRYCFYDGAGSKLDHDPEAYSEGDTYANTETWVEVPAIASGSTTSIWMYYGYDDGSQKDVNGTWDANFVAVWHLADGADSTSNGNTLTMQGDLPDVQSGKIGSAQDFDGTGDYADRAAGDYTTVGGNLTAEVWVNYASGIKRGIIHYGSTGSVAGNWYLAIHGPREVDFRSWPDGGSADTDTVTMSSDFNDSAWYYIALTRAVSDGAFTAYLNGGDAQVGAGTAGQLDDAQASKTLEVGAITGTSSFDGLMDELRVSSSIRSAAWIKFTHANIANAGNELTWGAEEDRPAAGGVAYPRPRGLDGGLDGGMTGGLN